MYCVINQYFYNDPGNQHKLYYLYNYAFEYT